MRITINQIKEMKQKGEKITMLTAYDYAVAKIVDEAGIPLIRSNLLALTKRPKPLPVNQKDG